METHDLPMQLLHLSSEISPTSSLCLSLKVINAWQREPERAPPAYLEETVPAPTVLRSTLSCNYQIVENEIGLQGLCASLRVTVAVR